MFNILQLPCGDDEYDDIAAVLYCGLISVIRCIVSIVIMFNDVYDVIQHYVHLSIIRCRIVACRKRPLDR